MVIYLRLYELKDVEIIEAHAMPDHIHILVKIPLKISVSSFMGYLKEKSAVIIYESYANLKYNYGNRIFGAKGCFVNTVGLNQKIIEKQILEQESEDRLKYTISKREYVDPFKSIKYKKY